MKYVVKCLLSVILILGLDLSTIYAKEDSAYVTICFDDAHSSVYGMGLPTLQQYGLTAMVFVPTIGIDDKQFWHMSWTQIVALQKVGWEIGSHSHTHQSMLNFSPEMVEEELSLSKNLLTKHGLAVSTFAAPFGDVSDSAGASIGRYYSAQRGTERNRSPQLEKSLNDLDVDPYRIASIQLNYEDSMEKIEGLIDKAIVNKKWIVFYLHAIVDERPEAPEYKFNVHKLSLLAAYLSGLQKKGIIQVINIRDFLAQRKLNQPK